MSTSDFIANLTVDHEGDFADRRKLAVRDRVEQAMVGHRVAPCVGRGSGYGMFDLDFIVDDPEQARSLIAQVMADEFSGLVYTLEFSSTDGDFDDLPFTPVGV